MPTLRQARAVRRCYGEGKSCQEAAEVIGKCHQNVSVLLARGLDRLRQAAAGDLGKNQTTHKSPHS